MLTRRVRANNATPPTIYFGISSNFFLLATVSNNRGDTYIYVCIRVYIYIYIEGHALDPLRARPDENRERLSDRCTLLLLRFCAPEIPVRGRNGECEERQPGALVNN